MAQPAVQKVRTFLWFDDQAEEAAKFYVSIFKSSKVVSTSPMSATFQLDGREFIAFNGGPMFKFTEAISLFVNCESQREVDELWEKLSRGGEESRCGWLKDKYGLSWQIIPHELGEWLGDDDDKKADRVMQAMLKMSKIDIEVLRRAYQG